eukprot:8870985-Alexandrium_andersonii.AAC.1
MGGPLKPFLRRLGFDPAVKAVVTATAAPAPTFVDDLSSLARAAIGLWRASLVIVAAARAAGLVIELRRCRGAILEGVSRVGAESLRRLQLDVRDCGPSCYEVTGTSGA